MDYIKKAQELIDLIISGRLFTSECVTDKEHPILTIWSHNADEQIAAFLKELRED